MTSPGAGRRRHELRQLILSKSGLRFRKVAIVMMEVMEHAPRPSEADGLYSEDEITNEIRGLIEAGQLEIVGDPARPRNREIRLRQP